MILYADSSSIVSLYLQEPGRREAMQEAVAMADFVACSLVAYAEVRAALARASREPPRRPRLDQTRYQQVVHDFDRDWRRYVRISPSNRLIRLAGDLAERHALKGYDAVHLASAVVLRDKIPDPVTVSAWDDRLNQAAVQEGFPLAH